MSPKPTSWLVRFLLPITLILVWLGLAGVGGPYFGKISDVSSNDLTTFLPNSAESTKANTYIKKFSDQSSIPAIVVFGGSKQLSTQELARLNELPQKLSSVKAVAGAISPAIQSDDKKAALLVIPIKSGSELKEVFPQVRKIITDQKTGVDFSIGGPASFAQDLQKAFSGIDVTLLLVALTAVFVILLVVYRSIFLPAIVLLTSMAALSVAVFIVWYLAKQGIIQLNGQVQGILFILVIGAATDYALLYLSRLREELFGNESVWEATKASLKGSFESILAAGGTVTVGLMCLLLSDLGSNKALGPVGGIGIGLAVLSSLTFLPAMLLLFGRAAFWPKQPKFDPDHMTSYSERHPFWKKVGNVVQAHPKSLSVGIGTVLLVLCLGVLQLKADGVPQSDLVIGHSEARDAQQTIDAHFAGGSGSPVYLVVNSTKVDELVSALDKDAGISGVSASAVQSPSGTLPLGTSKEDLISKLRTAITQERQAQIAAIEQKIRTQMPNAPQSVLNQAVVQASASIPSVDTLVAQANPFAKAHIKVVDNKALLQATLKDPADSSSARASISRLRTTAHTIDALSLIGGTTAIQYDTNQASIRDREVIIPIILLAITVILGLLLRSFVAPLILLATTVVSFGSTLGVSALLFNYVWKFPGTDPAVILFAFVFLVALGIDYNIFLMTRVREETLRFGVTEGTIKGLVVTGGVITSAGVVLASTFAALGVIPILFLFQIAFIVAFGVLLDTIIVRSLLVPAATLTLGPRMWWPAQIKSSTFNQIV